MNPLFREDFETIKRQLAMDRYKASKHDLREFQKIISRHIRCPLDHRFVKTTLLRFVARGIILCYHQHDMSGIGAVTLKYLKKLLTHSQVTDDDFVNVLSISEKICNAEPLYIIN